MVLSISLLLIKDIINQEISSLITKRVVSLRKKSTVLSWKLIKSRLRRMITLEVEEDRSQEYMRKLQ